MDQNNQNIDPEFQEEYKYMRADVKKVVITNVIILVLIVAAYLINRNTGFVDKLLKFF